jgi:hypothetical protein
MKVLLAALQAHRRIEPMRPLLRYAILAGGLAAAGPAVAQGRSANPDWPCPQRLVPKLSAGLFWSGPDAAAAEEWRNEPEVAALVEAISPRKISAEQGKEAIGAFAQKLDADRPRHLALVFAGLLEETNRQRGELIERIQAFARRQRDLADIAVRAGEELGKIPADAEGEAAERRKDLEQRRQYVSLAFQESQRTLRYACDAPVQLESRLGEYVRALQAALP